MSTKTNCRSTEPEAGFRVAFTARLRCTDGETTFEREERLPFAPFVGLVILDDSLGMYTLNQVAWLSERQLFCCHGYDDRERWSLEDAVREMARAGWEEEEGAREELDEDED